MRPDRHWLFLFVVVLVGVLIVLIYVLSRPNMFLFFLRQGINLVLATPQFVWWLTGGAILSFWGLYLLLQLRKGALPETPDPRPGRQSQGHLNELRKSLYETDLGTYSQDRVRQNLSTLAIDLIFLKLDISEEEARNLYFRADWTQDEIVKAYFYKQRATIKRRRLLSKWFKKSERTLFLKETSQVLNRLSHYSKAS
jgi:hypothetical protein